MRCPGVVNPPTLRPFPLEAFAESPDRIGQRLLLELAAAQEVYEKAQEALATVRQYIEEQLILRQPAEPGPLKLIRF